jgi:tRNA-dihydrouridine synthase A
LDPCEHPVALQLGGSEPALLAQAARIGVERWGFDEINLNCGCPSDRVQAGRFGACLMRDRAGGRCVAAMIEAVPGVPVTVKCRWAWTTTTSGTASSPSSTRGRRRLVHVFVVHARNAWLQGLSPKENRESPAAALRLGYRLKQERPDLQVASTAASPMRDEATRTWHMSMARCWAAPRTTTPYVLHELDAAWFGGEPAAARRPAARAAPLCRGAAGAKGVRSSTSPATCWACSMDNRAVARSARC